MPSTVRAEDGLDGPVVGEAPVGDEQVDDLEGGRRLERAREPLPAVAASGSSSGRNSASTWRAQARPGGWPGPRRTAGYCAERTDGDPGVGGEAPRAGAARWAARRAASVVQRAAVVEEVEERRRPLHLAGDGPLGQRVHVVEVAEHRAQRDPGPLGHGGRARASGCPRPGGRAWRRPRRRRSARAGPAARRGAGVGHGPDRSGTHRANTAALSLSRRKASTPPRCAVLTVGLDDQGGQAAGLDGVEVGRPRPARPPWRRRGPAPSPTPAPRWDGRR